jgi:hypothetical protein
MLARAVQLRAGNDLADLTRQTIDTPKHGAFPDVLVPQKELKYGEQDRKQRDEDDRR